MKKRLIALAQFMLGAGIIAFIIIQIHAKGDLGKLTAAVGIAACNWPLLVLGLLSFGVCLVLCSIRWKLFLETAGFRPRFKQVFRLYFVGQFFNAFLLGATGGDLVKACYVAVETPEQKTAAVSTIFIDRIIGLVCLVLLAAVMVFARLRLFTAHPETRSVPWFAVMAVIAVGIGFSLILARNIFDRIPFFKRFEQRTSLGKLLCQVYDAFYLCFTRRSVLVKAAALSIVNHTMFVLCGFFMAQALNLPLGFMDCLAVFPAINMIAAVPITPQGLGTREAANTLILGVVFGVPAPQALLLAMLTNGAVFFWSLVGGAVYMVSSLRVRKR